jgi:hypothetical protein
MLATLMLRSSSLANTIQTAPFAIRWYIAAGGVAGAPVFGAVAATPVIEHSSGAPKPRCRGIGERLRSS